MSAVTAEKTKAKVGRKLQPKTELGERFTAYVLGRYKGFKEAAEASGVSYQVLIDIASGRRIPLVTTMEETVSALGGTMAEFYAEPARKKPRKEK